MANISFFHAFVLLTSVINIINANEHIWKVISEKDAKSSAK